MAEQIAQLYAKIDADTDGLTKGLKSVKSDMSAMDKTSAAMGKALVGAFAVGVAAIAAFTAAIGSAVSAAAEFEQGVTDISAVMGLSGEEAAKLQDHIMDLGLDPDLKVSATEASEAIMALGTAGMTLEQIMGGASEATVLLANATGGDMGDAASLITDIMSQFNITAEESGRIVDQVTGLTIASKFAFNDAALAISQAGGMAGSVGVEFDDFNAILGVTAANFSSGSDAGTSLKTFLTTLIPKSVEAAGVMRDLGLYTGLTGKEFEDTQEKIGKIQERIHDLDPTAKNFGDRLRELQEEQQALSATLQTGSNAFFDNNGNMKSAAEIAELLQNALGGLSEEKRLDAASTIFGNDAARTAIGLMKAGAEGVTAMDAEIKKANATDIAAERMDTFAGSMEIAKGVMETLQISIGQKFLPVLRPLVDKFTELATTHGPAAIDFFGNLAGKIADIIAKGSEWVTRVVPPLWKGFLDITAAIKLLVKPITDAIDDFVSWKDVLVALAVLTLPALWGALTATIGFLTPIIVTVGAIVAAVAALRYAWEKNFLGIRDIAGDFFMGFTEWFKTYSGIWKGDWGKTFDYIRKKPQEAFGIMWREVETLWDNGVREVMHIVNGWLDDIEYHVNFLRYNILLRIQSFINGWIDTFESGIRIIRREIQEWVDWFNDLPWVQKGKEIIQGLWDGAQEIWRKFRIWWDDIWSNDVPKTVDVKMEIGSPSKLMERYGMWTMEGFAIGAKSALPMVEEAMSGIASIAAETRADQLARLGLDPNFDVGAPIPSAATVGRPAVAGANSSLGQDSAVLTLLQAILNELRRGNPINVTVSGGSGIAADGRFASVRP